MDKGIDLLRLNTPDMEESWRRGIRFGSESPRRRRLPITNQHGGARLRPGLPGLQPRSQPSKNNEYRPTKNRSNSASTHHRPLLSLSRSRPRHCTHPRLHIQPPLATRRHGSSSRARHGGAGTTPSWGAGARHALRPQESTSDPLGHTQQLASSCFCCSDRRPWSVES